MKHRCRWHRRNRRPAPPQPTRAQMRQHVARLCRGLRMEISAELRCAEPDPQHLDFLTEQLAFMDAALEELENVA